MRLDPLEKFKNKRKVVIYAFLATMALDILFKLGLIFVWNWIFGTELNELLFGEEELSVTKGLVVMYLITSMINNGNPFLLTSSEIQKGAQHGIRSTSSTKNRYQ